MIRGNENTQLRVRLSLLTTATKRLQRTNTGKFEFNAKAKDAHTLSYCGCHFVHVSTPFHTPHDRFQVASIRNDVTRQRPRPKRPAIALKLCKTPNRANMTARHLALSPLRPY